MPLQSNYDRLLRERIETELEIIALEKIKNKIRYYNVLYWTITFMVYDFFLSFFNKILIFTSIFFQYVNKNKNFIMNIFLI